MCLRVPLEMSCGGGDDEEAGVDEPGIPRSALNKLVREALPQLRVATDTRDLLHACCVGFIEHVGGEANRICARELRKTISHEHVQRSLRNLGFGADYVHAVQAVLAECRQEAQRRQRRQSSRLDRCGIPEHELLKQQQELFERARAAQAPTDSAQLMTSFQQLLAERLDRQQQQQQQEPPPPDAQPSTVSHGHDADSSSAPAPLPSVPLMLRCTSDDHTTDEDYDAL